MRTNNKTFDYTLLLNQLRYVHNQDSQHVPVQSLILPPTSQSQRTRVQRDNEIAELRKFKTNFVLAPPSKDQRRPVRIFC